MASRHGHDKVVELLIAAGANVNVVTEVSHWLSTYVCILSLGALVPNSRDRHEKQWRPDFMHHKTHPKMRFVCEKQTEVHF